MILQPTTSIFFFNCSLFFPGFIFCLFRGQALELWYVSRWKDVVIPSQSLAGLLMKGVTILRGTITGDASKC